jgi:hypothetical protein
MARRRPNMQAENPLDAYMVKCGITFDEEIGDLIDKLEINPEGGLIDFCLMVGGEDDFTAAVDRRMSKVFPGFYSLKYVGWGLTAIYVIWGTREEVVAKLKHEISIIEAEMAAMRAKWADPTTWNAKIATQIGHLKLRTQNVNMGLDMGYICYQNPDTDLIDCIEIRLTNNKWTAMRAKSTEEGYEPDKQLDEDADVAVLTSRLAASWGSR